MGAEFGAFFHNVTGADGESYLLYTLSGVAREAFAQFPMPRNTALFAPTFSGEGVVRSDDITQDPRYGQNAPYHGMPPGHLPVRSYLAVPVVSRTAEVIGGLFLGHSAAGVFTEEQEQLLTAIAAQAAVAIDNARLFEAETRARAAAEAAQLEVVDLNARLQRSMVESHHRIKNNLQFICAMVDLQAQETDGALSRDEVKRLASNIRALAELQDVLTQEFEAFRPVQRDLYARAAGAAAAASSADRAPAYDRGADRGCPPDRQTGDGAGAVG